MNQKIIIKVLYAVLAIIISVLLGMLAVRMTWKYSIDHAYENPTTQSLYPAEPKETGPGTVCKSDKDCWCRNFNGVRFLPGRVLQRCDTETNRCAHCIYE